MEVVERSCRRAGNLNASFISSSSVLVLWCERCNCNSAHGISHSREREGKYVIAAVTRRSPLMTELCPMLESDINATTRRRLPIAIADSLVEGIPVSPVISVHASSSVHELNLLSLSCIANKQWFLTIASCYVPSL